MTSPLTITGNLADAVDIRFSQAGNAWCSFTVMLNKWEKRGQNGEPEQTAKNGMRCIAFGQLAQNLADSTEKGSRVTVTGRLEPQQWQDRESGQDRYGWQLVAEDVAASMKSATVQITRNPRQEGQQGGYSGAPQGQGGYWAPQGGYAPQGAAQGGYSTQGGAQPSELGYGPQGGGYDAPPF